jgi:hypothetical protein
VVWYFPFQPCFYDDEWSRFNKQTKVDLVQLSPDIQFLERADGELIPLDDMLQNQSAKILPKISPYLHVETDLVHFVES